MIDGKQIIMAAAENAALPHGKVGGVGDVIRDLPPALAELGCRVSVLIPEYALFARAPGARAVAELDVPFAGETRAVTVLEIPAADERVRNVAFQHPGFAPFGPRIYSDDGDERPFASDATKFAFFSAAVASYALQMDTPPDVVHLHDWHAALYCVLRAFDPRYAALRGVPVVYTIHNLALQGIRPLDHDESSLAAWFHDLNYDNSSLIDPRYTDCINPVAAAIRLADKLNTVSPSYANEILRANDPACGFRGGEGLELDLQRASGEGRLVGILNGVPYPRREHSRPGWRRLLQTIVSEVVDWRDREKGPRDSHELALEHIAALPKKRPNDLLTCIGRLTDQKAALFMQATRDGSTALERILACMEPDGVLILLGSGDPVFEKQFTEISRRHPRFLFLCGYSETFSDLLYQTGDLFLMPSSFEPCGISQMLAMRASQPCVAHAVGGLKDTVLNEVNGFTFAGQSPVEQAENFAKTVQHALLTKNQDTDRWLKIRRRAAAERFSWATAAERYVEALYATD